MSDEELRRLERVYHQSQSPNDFLALNIYRIRSGLLPIREDPQFLQQWAAEIYAAADSDDEWDASLAHDSFSGRNE